MDSKKQPKSELESLREFKKTIDKLFDLELYPPELTSHWLGNAIMSFSRDKEFENHTDKEEAQKMLQRFYTRNFKLMKYLEKNKE